MSLSAIPKALRAHVFQRDRGRCQYRHLLQLGQAATFHINHIIPRSNGGVTETSNLVLQCPYCSLRKSNKMTAADPTTVDDVPLFHPLQQRWNDHFTLELDGSCHGASPTGRATIAALQMNDPLPRIARALQIRLGLLARESS